MVAVRIPTAATSSEGLTGAGESASKMGSLTRLLAEGLRLPWASPECLQNMAADAPQNEHPREKAEKKLQYLL